MIGLVVVVYFLNVRDPKVSITQKVIPASRLHIVKDAVLVPHTLCVKEKLVEDF